MCSVSRRALSLGPAFECRPTVLALPPLSVRRRSRRRIVDGTVAATIARLARHLRGLEPEHEQRRAGPSSENPSGTGGCWRNSSREARGPRRSRSPPASPGMASSSTCAARCPSAIASGAVGTSTRDRRVPTGSRRPTTIRDSRCTKVTTPDNVRLAHRLCNRRDYEWRTRINAMLGKRMSLEEIAVKLNAETVPTIHGTNRWTAASVRKAFVS